MNLRTFILLALLLLAPRARAYSLLTHEQLIDLTWQRSTVPFLLSRYPNLTPAQLEQARAYAYGGCVIQDLGYYPFGDSFFSDLTHYVRTGDFVVALFRNAQGPDELAFAVGALSHYIGDTIGHAEATNLAVPIEFPKLAAKYGSSVAYEQGEHQHVQTEFAFDINEISHHRMAPIHYLRHIGLGVSTRQLGVAFFETYGLGEDFSKQRNRRINVRGYRFAVRSFLPRVAYALNVLHRHHEPIELPSPDRDELNREIDLVAQQNDWNTYRRNPGIGTYSLAYFIKILPKIGPLKLAAIKGPTPQTDLAYAHSVLLAANSLSATLSLFTPAAFQTEAGRLASRQAPALVNLDARHPLPNKDLDTGLQTRPGTYRLTDSTYAELLHRLAAQPASPIPATIQQSILTFYANPISRQPDPKHPNLQTQIAADLAVLATIPLANDFDPYPTYPDTPTHPDPAASPDPKDPGRPHPAGSQL